MTVIDFEDSCLAPYFRGEDHRPHMTHLAKKEMHAPTPEARAEAAAHLDAYAARHRIKGWHRTTTSSGKHIVELWLLRGPAEGEKGRHFVHVTPRGEHWVVDRDTGKTVHHATSAVAAQAWVGAHEAELSDPSAHLIATGLRRGYHLTA